MTNERGDWLKEDELTLDQEIKAKKIDLRRYKEYLDDKAAFDKKVAAVKAPGKKGAQNKRYQLPADVSNITTSDIPKPDPNQVRQDLANLMAEYKSAKFEAYIDIYKGTHAMLKLMYHFEKYLEPALKKRCQKWCDHSSIQKS